MTPALWVALIVGVATAFSPVLVELIKQRHTSSPAVNIVVMPVQAPTPDDNVVGRALIEEVGQANALAAPRTRERLRQNAIQVTRE